VTGTRNGARGAGWDPYAVWQILVHRHPVHVAHPASSCGRIDRGTAPQMLEAIADYPDYLQDALLLIAHVEGSAAAMAALDEAVRDVLRPRRSNAG
jgi:hypothetical protein